MKTKRIEIRVTEDEFMWIGKYAGKKGVSEVIRELLAKLRKKSAPKDIHK